MSLHRSHLFASTLLKSAQLRTLLLLCWCCFFVLPAINAQGQINGYWVSLCTTNGTELVLVQNTDSGLEHDQHESTECPCAQYLFDTSTKASVIHGTVSNTRITSAIAFIQIEKGFVQLLPRAPPHIIYS